MSWLAYIDESGREDADGDHFVLGGCISTEERWKNFSEDWLMLLPRFGRVDKMGRYFHMAETKDMHYVAAFYRVIEAHIPVFISARFRKSEFKSALRRIVVPNSIIEWDNNDYFIAFRCLMDKFHLLRDNEDMQRVLPAREKIQFVFDDHSSKNVVLKVWGEYLENRPPPIRELYAGIPRFENDRVHLPLQAADLWAWWVRRWFETGQEVNIRKHDFGEFMRTPGVPRLTVDISFSEEQFIPTLVRMARSQVSADKQVHVMPSASGFQSFQWRC